MEEYNVLREAVGWGSIDKKMAEISLSNSLCHVTARDRGELIAMGRVVGDGAVYFYIQDVIVLPNYQDQGVGQLIMQKVELYLGSVTKPGSTIGLLAAKGKESFYTHYGYKERTGNPLGRGMCKFI